jgi:hypothetical protein
MARLGQAILLQGEEADDYDEMFTPVRAAVRPLDFIEEIFVDDVVSSTAPSVFSDNAPPMQALGSIWRAYLNSEFRIARFFILVPSTNPPAIASDFNSVLQAGHGNYAGLSSHNSYRSVWPRKLSRPSNGERSSSTAREFEQSFLGHRLGDSTNSGSRWRGYEGVPSVWQHE